MESLYDAKTIQDIVYCPTVDKVKRPDKKIWFDFRVCKLSKDWRTLVDIYKHEENTVAVYTGRDKKEVSSLEHFNYMNDSYDNVSIEHIPELKKYVKGI